MSAQQPTTETKTTTLAQLKQAPVPEAHLPEVAAGFTSSRSFELLQRAGTALSKSSLVPQIYQGNLSNCIIALEMAQRIGASPLMVMQNLYIVYNRPAWSAKFLIACFNQCGRFSAVRYIWSGERGKDNWGCQAWAIERETGEKIFGPVITLQLAKDEGWYGKKDSKWKSMPEKMFMYRAAAWMIDTHAPELSMGIRTEDEARDAFDARQDIDGNYTVDMSTLRQQIPDSAESPADRLRKKLAERKESQSSAPAAESNQAPAAGKEAEESEHVPMYDAQSAIKALEESYKARDLDALKGLYVRIDHDFRVRGQETPIQVEATYRELIEAIKEGAE